MNKGQFKERMTSILLNGGFDRLCDVTFELVKNADEACAWLRGMAGDEDDLASARGAVRDLKGSLRPFMGFDFDREDRESVA